MFSDFKNEEFDKDGIDTVGFEKFLRVQKNLADQTVKAHIYVTNIFMKHNSNDVQDFILWVRNNKSRKTYGNYLCTMKVLFRDYLKHPEMVNDFKFPTVGFKPKILPSKEQLKTFFDALPSPKYQIIFLALASSGLKVSELLTAKIEGNMVIPNGHLGKNKQSYISFLNDEIMSLLKPDSFNTSRNTLAHVFKDTARKTGVNITPQTLRSVFAREMSKAGVQDRYIDCFCGRTPQSVLARHYSDYSPEVLKEIYSKANIKILE